MKSLIVETGQSRYPVIIGNNILGKLSYGSKGVNLFGSVFAIVDRNVLKKHRGIIEKHLRNNSRRFTLFTLKPGEASKSNSTIDRIYSALLRNNFGRDTLVVAIGGGVTGDIAGFAASTYMRGVQLVHVPTTIIAGVDSAVGGKTGINYRDNKNLIGTFYQPEMVIVDTSFLGTLPKREITSGAGEIIKYSFLTNRNYYNKVYRMLPDLIANDRGDLEKLIYEAVNFKASVVSADEKERGLRKILNLGHTFAHAFESWSNFSIRHGEAVIAGVAAALFLSFSKGLLTEKELSQMLKIFNRVKLSQQLAKADGADLYRHMIHDKKNIDGKVKFVLVRGIGEIVTNVEAGRNDVLRAVSSALNAVIHK